jgi:hypothetical protein
VRVTVTSIDDGTMVTVEMSVSDLEFEMVVTTWYVTMVTSAGSGLSVGKGVAVAACDVNELEVVNLAVGRNPAESVRARDAGIFAETVNGRDLAMRKDGR